MEDYQNCLCWIVYEVVHSHKHAYVSSSYSSLDWVLSHWVHFSVRRFMFVFVYFVFVCFVLHIFVVLL